MYGKPISAAEFKNKATKLINIPGFEPGEEIQILIKPATLLSMIVGGKLPNELLTAVSELFQGPQLSEEEMGKKLLNDRKSMEAFNQMLEQVCQEVMLEPKYAEIKDYMTDEQRQSIFTQATGNVNQLTPIDKE